MKTLNKLIVTRWHDRVLTALVSGKETLELGLEDASSILGNIYIGKVVLSIPVIGGIAQSLTTGSGKIALFCLIAFILLLEILGSLLHKVEFKK